MWSSGGQDANMGSGDPTNGQQQVFSQNEQQSQQQQRQSMAMLNPSHSAQNLNVTHGPGNQMTAGGLGLSHSHSNPNISLNQLGLGTPVLIRHDLSMDDPTANEHNNVIRRNSFPACYNMALQPGMQGLQQFPSMMQPPSFYSNRHNFLSQSISSLSSSVPHTPQHNPQQSPQPYDLNQRAAQLQDHQRNEILYTRQQHEMAIRHEQQQQQQRLLGGSCPVTTTPQQGPGIIPDTSRLPQFGQSSFIGGGPTTFGSAQGNLMSPSFILPSFGSTDDSQTSGQLPGTSSAAPSTPASPRFSVVHHPAADGGFFTQQQINGGSSFGMPASLLQQPHGMQDDDGGLSAALLGQTLQDSSRPTTPREFQQPVQQPQQTNTSTNPVQQQPTPESSTTVPSVSASAPAASSSSAQRSLSEERKQLQKKHEQDTADLESRAKAWQKKQEEALENRMQEVRTEAERIIADRDGRITALEKVNQEAEAKAEVIERLEKENADLKRELQEEQAKVKRANDHIMSLNLELLRANDREPVGRRPGPERSATQENSSSDFMDSSAPAAPSGFPSSSTQGSANATSPSRQATHAIRLQQRMFSPVPASVSPAFGQRHLDLTPEPSTEHTGMSASASKGSPGVNFASCASQALTSQESESFASSISQQNMWSPQEPAPEPGSMAPEVPSSRPSVESSTAQMSRTCELSDRGSRSLSRRSSGEQDGSDDTSDVEFDCDFLRTEPPIPYKLEPMSGLPSTLPAPLTPQPKPNSGGDSSIGLRSVPHRGPSGSSSLLNRSVGSSGYISRSPSSSSANPTRNLRILPRGDFSGGRLFNGRVENDAESASIAKSIPSVLPRDREANDRTRTEVRSGLAALRASVSAADVPVPFSPPLHIKKQSRPGLYPSLPTAAMAARNAPLPLPATVTSTRGPPQLKINGGRLGSPSDTELVKDESEENFYDAEEHGSAEDIADDSSKAGSRTSQN